MSETGAARHKLHWLPNALTVSRILLIPVLVWLIYESNFSAALAVPALGLFILCGITDFIDGYLARKWDVASDFGRMLDPIADKLLVAACLIALSVLSLGSFWIYIPALIIIGRDISVSGIREYAALAGKVMAPTKLAKWKTTFEMLGIILLLAWLAFAKADLMQALFWNTPDTDMPAQFNPLLMAGIATLWLAAILSAYTGFHYFRSAMRK